jgi:hypothetical protein
MDLTKLTCRAFAAAHAKGYPVLWTAVLSGVLPVLVRAASFYRDGVLLFTLGGVPFRAAPVMAIAAFLPAVMGFLKYASRGQLLAYALWLATLLSVDLLGIVLFEAFSPLHQWSGSLFLPGVVALACAAGMVLGAVVRGTTWIWRRFGR